MRRVYIVIEQTRFFIGLLKRRGDFFVCEPCRESPNVTYNPSNLYLFITQFLQDHHVQRGRAIACCPYLFQWEGLKKKLAFFQVVLCLSKANLTIEHLFDEELF